MPFFTQGNEQLQLVKCFLYFAYNIFVIKPMLIPYLKTSLDSIIIKEIHLLKCIIIYLSGWKMAKKNNCLMLCVILN